MRLIDADAFLKRNEVYADCEFNHPKYQDTLREIIEAEPSVDAVEVVRCGKCGLRYKPLDDDVRNEIYCTFIGSTMRKDDFCSYGCADGERKDGAE